MAKTPKIKVNDNKGLSTLDKIKKYSTIKQASLMSESTLLDDQIIYRTRVPMLNVGLGGSIMSGLGGGLMQIAGPSKHFKSSFGLLLCQAFLRAEPDGIILFYDSEFGTPASYFQSFEIDPSRAFHSPITNVEELKQDIMAQLFNLTKDDKVLIFIDSIGNLASKKEVEDALNQNEAADMTRAKQIKSLFRMITPHLNLKDIPCVCINHTYQSQERIPKTIVGGGTGGYYSADTIWVVGRQEDAEGKDADKVVHGYLFNIKIEKSRFVREKSKIQITVRFDGGIEPMSGLFDLALEAGYIVSPTQGWYSLVDQTTGEVSPSKFRRGDKEFDPIFMAELFKTTDFQKWIENKFMLTHEDSKMLDEAKTFSLEDNMKQMEEEALNA